MWHDLFWHLQTHSGTKRICICFSTYEYLAALLISHTIVVENDSKFLGVFAHTAALLNTNIHVLSGENHDPMIVERIWRFLNSCLTIFATRATTITLLWKVFWFLCMHGILRLLLALTYPVACWLLDGSLTLLLTYRQSSIKYWPPTLWKYQHLRFNNPTSLSVGAQLRASWFITIKPIIMSTLTIVALTHACFVLEITFLQIDLSNPSRNV